MDEPRMRWAAWVGLWVLPATLWAFIPEVEVVQAKPVYTQKPKKETSMVADNQVRRFASMQEHIDTLQDDVQHLRGQLEEQAWQLRQLQEAQEQISTVAEQAAQAVQHMLEAQSVGVAEEAHSPQAIVAEETPEPEEPEEPVLPGEQSMYQSAYERLQARDYPGALKAFQEFLVHYPESDSQGNAHYWIGEICLLTGDMPSADHAFAEVSSNALHPKAADALLKRGFVRYKQHHWLEASAYFNDVRSRYPGTAAARLAEGKLKAMQHEGKV